MVRLNWRERIDAARARGHFTNEDREWAADWRYCAVGEQDVPKHQSSYRSPIDDQLVGLGCAFSRAVGNDDVGEAETTYRAIAFRALLLRGGP